MIKTDQFLAALSVLLLAALACAQVETSTPAGPTGLPAGESTRTLAHDGLERSYILYMPASLNRDRPAPLVFVFHGGTGNAQSAIRMSGFNEIADQNGFIVVYPNGTGRLNVDKLLTWNGGTCCAYAQEKNVDDVGFVRTIVADLRSLANLDAKRIYATGMSNGAILSHRLACQAADIFAAIAPVAGTLNFPACHPSEPVSIIEFHGTADKHIPYDGGLGPASLVEMEFASVPDSVGFWASSNGCSAQPQTNSFDDVRHEVWTGCLRSTSVELYTIVGGGHAWPGGLAGQPDADRPIQTISASHLIWEYFAAHPKP